MMGMRAVCTGNGWSPNPADLSCSVGMLVMVTGSCQGARVWYIVQWKLLQMSAGPLEELLHYTHALAMLSTSFYSIAIYCVFCEANSEKLVYGLATCQCNRTFQGLQFSWGWQGMQLCPFYKLLYGFPCKNYNSFHLWTIL